jgi:hypothetical protein
MDERSVVADRLRKKMQEIQSLEERLRTAKIYVQALQDVMRAIGAPLVGTETKTERSLRSGSTVSQARDVILKAGRPVHLSELLAGVGKEDTRESRASLTSSLAAYVRRGEIFTRPAPNTFGLVELGHGSVAEPEPEPPDDFGGYASTTLRETFSTDPDDEISF